MVKKICTELYLLNHIVSFVDFLQNKYQHMRSGGSTTFHSLILSLVLLTPFIVYLFVVDKPKWYQCRSVADFADMENPQFQGLAALTAGIVHGVAGPGKMNFDNFYSKKKKKKTRANHLFSLLFFVVWSSL